MPGCGLALALLGERDGLGLHELQTHVLHGVPAYGGKALHQLLVKLSALCHDVDGLTRQHAHVHAHVPARLGVDAHAGGEAGAVRLHDVGRLGGDRVARDGDDAAVDGRDLHGADAPAAKDRAGEKHEQPQGAHDHADEHGKRVGLEVEQGRRGVRPGPVPREREGRDHKEVREHEDDRAEAFESAHVSLQSGGVPMAPFPRIPQAADRPTADAVLLARGG